LEKSASELVQMSFSDSILEAAIGLASINSLIEVDKGRCVELNERDLLVEKGKGKKVVIIGHFPFIDKLRGISSELTIIEKKPVKGISRKEMPMFFCLRPMSWASQEWPDQPHNGSPAFYLQP